jgi:acetyl esterase/lipase
MKREARSALANAQYYTTWLMRLEGAPEAEWQAEIDASRQNYKLVAEQALAGSDAKSAKVAQDDLESAIRLARMDIADLQGLPLPSQ